jgi:hypothetical protein
MYITALCARVQVFSYTIGPSESTNTSTSKPKSNIMHFETNELNIGQKYHTAAHQWPLKVEVQHVDGKIIETGVDIRILRRFSNAAKEVLPILNLSDKTLQKPANLKLVIKPTGYFAPSDFSIQGLLLWMTRNEDKDLPK